MNLNKTQDLFDWPTSSRSKMHEMFPHKLQSDNSISSQEKLEEEMTRRRLMEDEIYKLKLEINEFKTHTDKAM